MRKKLVGALAALLAGAGLGTAEAPPLVPTPAVALPAPSAVAPVPAVSAYPGDGSCGEAPCAADCCDNSTCVWLSADYLLWWVKNGPQPLPLLTTAATAPADLWLP